jgi:hypothetical protein
MHGATPRATAVASAALSLAALLPWFAPLSARAQSTGDEQAEDDGSLDLMDEPITFTDVIDAFDDDDVFDVNIGVAYQRTWEFATIQRQVPDGAGDPTVADSRMSQHWNDIANYELGRNQLNFGLDVGIFRDFAAYARLPLILSDDRSLSQVGNTDPSGFLTANPSMDPSQAPLFSVPFRSPTRSGVDYMVAGLAWSITNQHRDRHVPTWMVMLEGQFNLGDPMRACGTSATTMGPNGSGAPGTMQCGNISSNPTGSLNPGVGRGYNSLRFETRSSYRYESIEPYAGLAFQIGWPGYSGNQFLPQGNLQGYINQIPPILGRFTIGTAIIPWEDREHYQRFMIDLRLVGDYVSEGHDYSPLFDALGSSNNTYLSSPNLEGQPFISDPPDPATESVSGLAVVPFYGLTDTQSHGRFGGTLTLEMQAARYVRFSLATGFLYAMPYVITQADACNPNVSQDSVSDQRLVGTCRGGIINPAHRPAIDLPGQRFRVNGTTQVDITISVTAQF